FLFNHTPPTDIYTLSLHDALPISISITSGSLAQDANRAQEFSFTNPRTRIRRRVQEFDRRFSAHLFGPPRPPIDDGQMVPLDLKDRKSTRLNSSHEWISYAVFCLK